MQTVQQNLRWEPNNIPNLNYTSDEDDFESGNSTAKLYERSRIKALADEREIVQKKTFTKWVNSHLSVISCNIEDLYMDLRDGKMLLKLLEILSGERLPRPTKGKMRIHCLENVDKSLNFLCDQRVHLENVGAHDIVDGSARLTLGLIWTIILRFQIQDIMIEEDRTSEVRCAKDALLLWCQMKTAGYPNVNVRNFSTSWRDGLAFNALIHKHRPDLINYPNLAKSEPMKNLGNAFTVAEEKLGVPRLLESQDVCVEQPDEKSIMTYVVAYYHHFNKMKADTVHSKRIGKVINQAIETDKLIQDYEQLTSDLLDWIEKTIELLNNRTFSNSLSGVQHQLAGFNTYRTTEKPPKFQTKGGLEVLLFTIRSRLRGNNQQTYNPPEGKLISDINRAWQELERAEHARELALRDELIRQEKLEQLASRFDRKAGLREGWLSDNQQLLAQDNFGQDLASVEAATKKHEAIVTDIYAYEERMNAMVHVAAELERENYYDIERIRLRRDNVLELWDNLRRSLDMRQNRLDLCLELQHVFQEIIYLMDWIEDIKNRLKSTNYGKHLMGVEDLIQKHDLIEADIRALANRMEQVLEQAEPFITGVFAPDVGSYRPVEPEVVEDRKKELHAAYDELCELANARRNGLFDSRKMWQFFWDMEDEKEWIKEKSQLMSSPDLGHDLSSVGRLLRKHKALEKECQVHRDVLKQRFEDGDNLINENNLGADKIRQCIDEMNQLWDQLVDLTTLRKQRLIESQESFQLMADCDDADMWLSEQQRIVSNEDVGLKLATTESLLKNNQEVIKNLEEFRKTIDQLQQQGAKISDYPDCDTATIDSRLAAVDRHYADVLGLAKLRDKHLTDALSMYKLFDVSDTVRTWLTEKEKLLTTLVPSDEIELEVIRNRFECLEKELTANAEKVEQVNKLSEELIGTEHPDGTRILDHQDDLNASWNKLADLVDHRKRQLDVAYQYNQYLIESEETANWIKDKAKLIESTDELGNDLSGIMQLQRRLGGLQRDLKAIEAKVDHLDSQAAELCQAKPENVPVVQAESQKIHELWNELKEMLKERDDRLNYSSELQRFLQNLDHFQLWLRSTQMEVASEDVPANLQEAEALLERHRQLKVGIDGYEDDFHQLMELGRRETADQTDDQYKYLADRLDQLEDDWKALHIMYDKRTAALEQSVEAQTFFRDALLAELLLSKMDHALSKEETPTSLEMAQEDLRRWETLQSSIQVSDERAANVIEAGLALVNRGIFPVEKIQAKCDQLQSRRESLKKHSDERGDQLHEQVEYHEMCQNVGDAEEWIVDKKTVAVEAAPPTLKSIAVVYNRFKNFESELDANKEKIAKVIEDTEAFIVAHPTLQVQVEPRLMALREQWDDINKTASERSAKMADANRETLFDETAKSMMTWITEVSSQIVTTTEEVTEEIGLVEINEQIKDQERKDQEMAAKLRMLEDMAEHAEKLKEQYPERREEFEQVHQEVRIRLTELEAPLADRRDRLAKQKRVRQFLRDIDDEKDWIQEKLQLLEDSNKVGNSLLAVQQLLRRHRMLTMEVENHTPRINLVCEEGGQMIQEGHPRSDRFREAIEELWTLWSELQQVLEERQRKLLENEQAQQYLFDASEAEAWMGEQELYLMGDDRAKDEQAANNAVKRHELLQKSVENYASEICSLGERSRAMLEANHPEAEAVAVKQARVDKMYAGLRDLCAERHLRLEEILKLYSLLREILDLEAWIADRIVLANSHELGADFEHCCLLRDRFAEFARETNDLGKVRVGGANEICDALIDQGHGEAAEIASWKDRVNEAWADLLELIDTRIQLLKTAWDLHKFLSDCQDVLERIAEKASSIPEEVGRDAKAVAALQRKHATFEYELSRLNAQVEGLVESANALLPSYAADKEQLILDRREAVVLAWRQLQCGTEQRKGHLLDAADVHRFFAMVRELRMWMEVMRTEMATKEKPRDVSGVELLMNNHRSLKAEIDAREENFSICLSLGRTLLNRRHPREDEVREKCIQLVTERVQLNDQWKERWETLQLLLEVYQFARDAEVAYAWLMAQEPYLASKDLGDTLDETLALLKKHLEFERAAATQEERFLALRKLTTLELKARERTAETEAARFAEKERRVAEAIREFQPPPPMPLTADEISIDQRTPEHAEAPSTPRHVRGSRDSGRPPAHDFEGVLNRKHEWQTGGKKASSRSWHELYFILSATNGVLSAYKEQRLAKVKPGEYYRHEPPVNLAGTVAAPAFDYTKRRFVFRLRLSNGAESLFQAGSEDDMHAWIQAINAAAGTLPAESTGSTSAAGGRAATLPHATATTESQPPSASVTVGKKKFFTLGRKKT